MVAMLPRHLAIRAGGAPPLPAVLDAVYATPMEVYEAQNHDFSKARFVKADPRRARDLLRLGMPWHEYVLRWGIEYYPTSGFYEDEEPDPLPLQSCLEDQIMRGDAASRSSDAEAVRLITLLQNAPFALFKTWVPKEGRYRWEVNRYSSLAGVDLASWGNFAFNQNGIRKQGTSSKGKTTFSYLGTRDLEDHISASGSLENPARHGDTSTPILTELAWLSINSFNNAKFHKVEYRNGDWVVNRRSIGSIQGLESAQAGWFTKSLSERTVRIAALPELLDRLIRENPFRISNLDEYAMAAGLMGWLAMDMYMVWSDPGGRPEPITQDRDRPPYHGNIPYHCYGRIPTYNRYAQNYDPRLPRVGPKHTDRLEVMYNAQSPGEDVGEPGENFIVLDIMFQETFTHLNPANFTDDEKWLRLRKWNFQNFYPNWACSLRDKQRVYVQYEGREYQKGFYPVWPSRLTQEQRTAVREAQDPIIDIRSGDDHQQPYHDRLRWLKESPAWHSQNIREDYLGAWWQALDYRYWREIRDLINKGSLTRTEVQRKLDNKFLRHPYRVHIDLANSATLEDFEGEMERTIDMLHRVDIHQWLYYFADRCEVIHPMICRTYPTPGMELYDWGWAQFIAAVDHHVGEGGGTQDQPVLIYSVLAQIAIANDTASWLRALREVREMFGELEEDVDHLRNWVYEGLMSRKIIRSFFENGLMAKCGLVETQLMKNPEVERVLGQLYSSIARCISDATILRYGTPEIMSQQLRDEERHRFDMTDNPTVDMLIVSADSLRALLLGHLKQTLGRYIDPLTKKSWYDLDVVPILMNFKPKIEVTMEDLLKLYDTKFVLTVLPEERMRRFEPINLIPVGYEGSTPPALPRPGGTRRRRSRGGIVARVFKWLTAQDRLPNRREER